MMKRKADMTTTDLLNKTLEGHGYRIESSDASGIIFKYQLNNIVARPDDGDRFVALMLPVSDVVNDDNRQQLLGICNKMNSEIKQIKVYLTEAGFLVFSSEFFYEEDKDFPAFFRYGLHLITEAKTRFRSLMNSGR